MTLAHASEVAVEHGAHAAEHGAHAVEHAAVSLSQSQLPMLILVPLLLGAVIVPGLGLWRRRLAYPVTILALLLFLGAALRTLFEVLAVGRLRYTLAGWTPPIGIELSVDPLSAFVATVVAELNPPNPSPDR